MRFVPLVMVAVSVAEAAAAEERSAPAAWRERFDELWKRRDDPKAAKELGPLVRDAVEASPKSFDANWRQAALLSWSADGASEGTDLKAQLGKSAWGAADRAIAARPDDGRGYYYAAVGVGLYSEGIGILTALREGIEGKFRDYIQTALRIDKDFLDGAPQVVWGRYFYKLPWPKRDVRRAIEVLSACAKEHPRNLRAKLYLADALDDEGNKADAKKLIGEITDAPVSGDQPEERRIKALARKWTENR
jgi:hypothetical protein